MTPTPNLMICLRGEAEHLPYLQEITALEAGIELGSYGMVGIKSERDWNERLTTHASFRAEFQGALAIHGPFIGIEYAHIDHLIRDVVNRRLDMTFDVALQLKAQRVILHSGYTATTDAFKLQDDWLTRNVPFWQQEIHRWADSGIEIVLENETEQSPDILIRLVNEIDSPFLGLCLDVGHQHVFSEQTLPVWVQKMRNKLFHVHLHDNDRSGDKHWALGRGTIDFESFYEAIFQYAPHATMSLESVDTIEGKMNDLRKLAARFPSCDASHHG